MRPRLRYLPEGRGSEGPAVKVRSEAERSRQLNMAALASAAALALGLAAAPLAADALCGERRAPRLPGRPLARRSYQRERRDVPICSRVVLRSESWNRPGCHVQDYATACNAPITGRRAPGTLCDFGLFEKLLKFFKACM